MSNNRYLEKLAGMASLLGKARGMAMSAGRAVKNYASEVPGDAKRLVTNVKNIKTLNSVNGPAGTAGILAKNKAVQVAGGALAAGGLMRAMRSKKQDSE